MNERPSSTRARRVLVVSENALLVAMTMFLASLALWVGVPLSSLWLGSRIQAGTGSVGFALLAMLMGMLVTIAVLVGLLGHLNRRHIALQQAQGRAIGETTALEQVLVGSAAVALICFFVWFFGFSGSPPIPGLEFSL
jgi:hypothetical protein